MGAHRGDVPAFKSQRAHRYPIRVPVRYRSSGHKEWHEGKIENISRSGLLFEAEHAVAADTRVEMRFFLPETMSVEHPAEVVCRGKIVRTVPTSERRGTPALAATIATYRFRRRGLSRHGS